MGEIKIVTDSTADLPVEIIENYGVKVVPLKVFFGNEEFRDGENLSPAQFFEKLKTSKELPTTSQPSPSDFVECYQPLVDEGAQVISIHISSGLSGTLQSAELARKMLDYENIEIIDSKVASVPLGMMVVAAARAARKGKSKDEILGMLSKMKENQYTFFVVDTLDYLQRGGRIGKAQAFLGTLLNVKPLLVLRGGIVYPHEKVRGRNKAFKRVVQSIKENTGNEELWVYIAYGDNIEASEKLLSEVESNLSCREVWKDQLGPVIGTHVGPGVFGLCACKVPGIIND